MSSLLVSLDENALEHILCQIESVQDLLRLGRSCSRLHSTVQSAEAAWQRLYTTTYPPKATPPSAASPPAANSHAVCYRQLFKDRWMRDARELRLQRRVQRMRLQSDSAQLQREIVQLQHQLHAESKTQQSLEQQLRDCQRARLAGSASLAGQWQLGAVQLYHNRVVQAAPVRLEAKLAELQQQQKVSRLQQQTLKSSISLRRQRLTDTQRRLAALDG